MYVDISCFAKPEWQVGASTLRPPIGHRPNSQGTQPPPPPFQIHARPTASAGAPSDWATLIKSLAGAEKTAYAAPKVKSAPTSAGGGGGGGRAGGQGGGGGGGGDGGEFKVFAASGAPAAGSSRGVRGFAGAGALGAGSGNGSSMVAPTSWQVERVFLFDLRVFSFVSAVDAYGRTHAQVEGRNHHECHALILRTLCARENRDKDASGR